MALDPRSLAITLPAGYEAALMRPAKGVLQERPVRLPPSSLVSFAELDFEDDLRRIRSKPCPQIETRARRKS
jgi:hypothetical protein